MAGEPLLLADLGRLPVRRRGAAGVVRGTAGAGVGLGWVGGAALCWRVGRRRGEPRAGVRGGRGPGAGPGEVGRAAGFEGAAGERAAVPGVAPRKSGSAVGAAQRGASGAQVQPHESQLQT